MELSKNDTKMIQGFSVLAMLLLHLFCRYNCEELFTPIIYIGGVPLSFMIGQLSDFCVMGFAFCSGYAQYLLWKSEDSYYRRRLRSLLALYIKFWVICVLFSLLSIIVGKGNYMPGSIRAFLLTITSVQVAYNGAWWYLFIYAVITVVSPWLLKWIEKSKTFFVLIVCSGVYIAAFYVRFHTPGHGWLLEKFGTGGMTFFEWYVGVFFCKERLFTRIKKRIDSLLSEKVQIAISVVLFVGMLLVRGLYIRSLLVAPATGLLLILIFHYWKKPAIVIRTFSYLGSHSTNIWLTHMFFFSGLFVNFVFVAKYPLLILLFMLMLSLISSYVIDLVYRPIVKLLVQ